MQSVSETELSSLPQDNSDSLGYIPQPSTSHLRSHTPVNGALSDVLLSTESHDYEHDGRHCDMQRDPPGQKSTYILPGDPEKETYRLSTFVKFPSDSPVNPCVLASHGFSYTGYKDRVKCFSCGVAISDWCVQDDPRLAKWHLRGCELVLGKDTRNVSILGRPIQFVGTFDSCLDSGYASSYSASSSGASSSGASSSFDRPSCSQSYTQSNNFTQNRLPPVAADATTYAQETQINGAPGIQKVANANQRELPNLTATSNGTHSASFNQSARPVIEKKTVVYKVEGLNLASVNSPSHKNLLLNVLDLHKEEDRIKSFVNWPSKCVTIKALAKSGFFYLGSMDRVQCFSCSGVLRNWRQGDNVDHEHRVIIPDCKMVRKQEYRNVPIAEPTVELNPFDLVEPPDPSPEEKRILEREFPCLHPVNAHMRNFEARLQTFDQRWPSDRVLATKDHIAKAGFFYLGERDRAKCWYCNGGLQNWDPKDEPFTEHAKWFPGCEFMLRCKGIDFVKRIVAQFPNLRRPTLRNARLDHRNGQLVPSSASDQLVQTPIIDPRNTNAGDILMQYSPSTSNGTGPVPSNPSHLTNGVTVPKIERELMGMGFQKEQIKRARKKLRDEGRNSESVAELVDLLLNDTEMEEEPSSIPSVGNNSGESMMHGMANGLANEIPVMNNAAPGPREINNAMDVDQPQDHNDHKTGSGTPSKVNTGLNPNLSKELAELEYERRCKTCHQREADTVIIPCGHLSLCSACSPTTKRCGVCNLKVQSFIKVFLA